MPEIWELSFVCLHKVRPWFPLEHVKSCAINLQSLLCPGMCKIWSVLWTQGSSWPLWPDVFCRAVLRSYAFVASHWAVYVEIIVFSRAGASCGGAVACSLQQSAHCGADCSPAPFAFSTWILRVPACCVLCVLSVYFVCRLLIIFGLTLYSLL